MNKKAINITIKNIITIMNNNEFSLEFKKELINIALDKIKEDLECIDCND